MNPSTAHVIILDGIEELETVAPVDCLRRAGVHVTVASAGTTLTVTGRNGIKIVADVLLDSLQTDCDLLIIPGGPSHKAMAADERILERLRRQDAAGKLIGSICAGPVVLNRAGVIQGRAFTSFPGTRDELPARDAESKVVKDGNLITSQAAGTATAFAIALVEALCGPEAAAEIAASICY